MIRGFVLLGVVLGAASLLLLGTALPVVYASYGPTGIALAVASVMGIVWLRERGRDVPAKAATTQAFDETDFQQALVELQTRARGRGGDASMRRGEALERFAAQIAS